jgi:NADPH:quinone reductase
MNHAIRVYAPGGPEVLTYEEISMPKPAPGEVLIRQTAIGLNFIDVYHRTGLYPLPAPFIPGMEAAGVVEEIGNDVKALKKGDRVGYATRPIGAYVEYRIMAEDRLIKIPDGISDEQAAAALEKGMTAEYLLHRTFPVQKGQTILFHAAAGGVGLIACQWAKSLGVTVIGTVSSEEKAKLAKENGCEHVIIYTRENFTERVREITDGKGVPVVYDSVGKTTFLDSLDCLSPRGMMVSFGNASGPVDPFPPGILSQKGSLYLTRPSMNNYTEELHEYQQSAKDLFAVMKSGAVKIDVRQKYALKDAAQAHRDLESRKTTGSSIFISNSNS